MNTTLNRKTLAATFLANLLAGVVLAPLTGLPVVLAMLLPIGVITIAFGITMVVSGFRAPRQPLAISQRRSLRAVA